MSEINIRDMGVAGTVIMENEVVALQSQLDQAHEALLLAHPGTALADEVRAVRMDAREARKDSDYWRVQAGDVLLDLHATQAQLAAARPLVEEARSMVNADCDCLQCVRIGALLTAYDALAKDGEA